MFEWPKYVKNTMHLIDMEMINSLLVSIGSSKNGEIEIYTIRKSKPLNTSVTNITPFGKCKITGIERIENVLDQKKNKYSSLHIRKSMDIHYRVKFVINKSHINYATKQIEEYTNVI